MLRVCGIAGIDSDGEGAYGGVEMVEVRLFMEGEG